MNRTPELERLLRQQRGVSWILSTVTFVLTVGFFALMGFNASVLSRVALGHGITMVNVVAIVIIIMFLLSIAIYGRLAARIDVVQDNEQREP